MASKNVQVKGVRIEAPTRQQAETLYRNTVSADLNRLIEKTARDDVQINVGELVIRVKQ